MILLCKTQIIYHFAHANGPFGHLQASSLPNLKDHTQWLNKLESTQRISKEIFVKHFFRKYGSNHDHLPIWMAAETMTFGDILSLHRGMDVTLQKKVAAIYNVPDKVFTSWLRTLNAVRNICAHHARLWNRVLGYKPLIPNPNRYPHWHVPSRLPNERVFIVLTILKHFINILSHHSKWNTTLNALLDEYPDIDRQYMGFPTKWGFNPYWYK